MPIRRFLHLTSLAVIVAAALNPTRAEDIVFPPDAGVIDVTRAPYHARGDGVSNDTDAIQQALLEHGNSNRILYFPNGTYRIAGTLRWPESTNPRDAGRLILQGQSREKTVLQLLDYAPAFGNSGRPVPMIWTGGSGENNLRNAVRNLTLHTGEGNPGAIGIQFLANKQGTIRDVDIIAGGDGSGSTGLDLSSSETPGPLLVKNVRIRGFDTGIRAANPVHSVTLENIEVTDQKLAGIRNSAQVLTLRHLVSSNTVPALQIIDGAGVVTLLDSSLHGLPAKRPGPGILNRGVLIARNLTSEGYTNVIENRAGHGDGASGAVIPEYQSHEIVTLFPAPPFSLNLPVQETPEAPWDPLSDWASPSGFGGKPDDNGDDSEAIQKAIDSGATTVYLPHGTWTLKNPVELRGKVRRILGTEARLVLALPEGQPGFQITNTTAPTFWLERLEIEGTKNALVDLAAERQVVLIDCLGVSVSGKAKTELFFEDVSSVMPLQLGPGQSLWARQWFQGFQGLKLANRGGAAWLMGYTTERPGVLVNTMADGKTEILGGLCIANGSYKTMPMFRIEDAAASIVMAEASFTSTPYEDIVLEVRKGVQRKLRSSGITSDRPLPQRVGGIAVPLYTGYFGVGAVEPRTGPAKPKTSR